MHTMDYNYYPAQATHPPPPNQMSNCSPMLPGGGNMMHTTGPPQMHPQPPHPQQNHIGHPGPQPHMPPHHNFHQLPPHPPLSHSASPHPSPHHNSLQPPPPPLHHYPPPPQPQHQPPPPPPHHYPPPPPPMNQPLPHSQPPPPLPSQHLPPMHHGPPPPPIHPPYMSHGQPQPGFERGSPFYQAIPQTEYRIIELNKRLQQRPRSRIPESALPNGLPDESFWWQKFTSDFFDDDSTLTLRLILDGKHVEYTIGRTLIPKYFKTYFDAGVVDLSIKLRNSRETVHPHLIRLECDHADITAKNIAMYCGTGPLSAVVHTEGQLVLDFVSNSFDQLVIKTWRFYTHRCHEYIDRSMTSADLPPSYLLESVTKHGLTSRTLSYLKMCQIIEPMQVLMSLQKQLKKDPRGCLNYLLYDKYKLKNVEDNRAQPSKRRKRKAPATTGTTGGTKKGKANANNINNANQINNNNAEYNNMNNNLMPPSIPNMALASQDVMVVSEPSVLGADFEDENERRITRLENNQFDVSTNNNGTSGMNQNQNQMSNNNGNQASVNHNGTLTCPSLL